MDINMKNKNGFTLIETMVAVAIFFIIMTIPTSFFVLSINGQQKALAAQEITDNVSYVLEYMSRSIRMAKKDLSGTCIDEKFNYKITRGGKGIKFINYHNECQEFFWDVSDNRLKEIKDNKDSVPMTSESFQVISFKIGPSVSWGQDNGQPIVTFYLNIKGKKLSKPAIQSEIKVQATISQRNINVKY